MGTTWTKEDAARRLLFLFIGKQPGQQVHVSQLSAEFLGSQGTVEELLAAVNYATARKWLSFDGECLTLLREGFAQPHELPLSASPEVVEIKR